MENIEVVYMSRTIICPKCGGYAVIFKRISKDREIWYVVRCSTCGIFKISPLVERRTREKYTKIMKVSLNNMVMGVRRR